MLEWMTGYRGGGRCKRRSRCRVPLTVFRSRRLQKRRPNSIKRYNYINHIT